ncbi:MAG: Zn-dependent hydrolase [Clostridia bacterium]|nr:Zn-dependent hydrolase [Clostridia bacterium]MBQ4158621.1 Zn-dependent hydrolase [Clostridia bacterium]
MKKTYVATMPDHVGAFLQASRIMSKFDINITRVSYNKAVDMHTLFIEVSGSPEKIEMADEMLRNIGYLQNDDGGKSIVLLEFRLKDEPGSAERILSLISDFRFNISYMSSQENGSEYQLFKMGLFVENKKDIRAFLEKAEKICSVRVMDYNHTEKNYDNSIFYQSYATALAKSMDIEGDKKQELLIYINLAMQVLDERGLSPYRTFDSISRFADMLASFRADSFNARISKHDITENTSVTIIEPPCGSNTMIIKSMGEYLFADTGYACYKDEMIKIFHALIPDFDDIKKHALITHADLDHCGLLSMFEKVYMSRKSADCLRAEINGEDGYREKNPLHKPYIKICKCLTGYKPMNESAISIIGGTLETPRNALECIGSFSFGELYFEVLEGKGGHLPGEIVLIDYEHRIAFTGDVYINIGGMTPEQAAYNQYAPILMTSVDTNPALCKAERNAIMARLGIGNWQVFGAHGMKKDYSVKA